MTYVIVQFPESQDLMELKGFEENCCLVNDSHFVEMYGSSAYFVNVSWLESNSKFSEIDEPTNPFDEWDFEACIEDERHYAAWLAEQKAMDKFVEDNAANIPPEKTK